MRQLTVSLGVMEIHCIFVICASTETLVYFRFFLTIGYGDYAPGTQAGRPVFIVYALLAVPTMTIIGSPQYRLS
jgi:hypothetical protein